MLFLCARILTHMQEIPEGRKRLASHARKLQDTAHKYMTETDCHILHPPVPYRFRPYGGHTPEVAGQTSEVGGHILMCGHASKMVAHTSLHKMAHVSLVHDLIDFQCRVHRNPQPN